MTRERRRTSDNRGFVLISSYLLLFLFLIYSNALTVQTMTQRTVADRARDQLQATNLAQGAVEQLTDEFYQFLATSIYQLAYQGDAIKTMQWLDQLGQSIVSSANPPSPLFVLADRNADGVITAEDMVSGQLDGTAANPRLTSLPPGNGTSWLASITSLNPADPLATRRVTLLGEATIGGVTKRIRAVYDIELGMSDIFRYAYFVNNYGWFDVGGSNKLFVRGEVRANGDLTFSGKTSQIQVNGDLYAAKNPQLINPVTKQPAVGTITGDPAESATQSAYWTACATDPCGTDVARPTQKVTFPGQPAIGGSQRVLPYGKGWDSDNPNQKRFAAQSTQPIPYLGNLTFYKSLALQKGSKLTYYNSATKKTQTINAVYTSNDPLVLVGTASKPIVLDGPVVVPGDVIIKGYVQGRGTIYAGRNVHVVGELKYVQPPQWTRLERNQVTGRIARQGLWSSPSNPESNLGTVCNNGTYVAPGNPLPSGCP